MRIRPWLAAAILTSGVPAAARAQVLNFEGIGSTTTQDLPFINTFYNGGTSSNGSSGTNFGVTFSPNAIELCLNTLIVHCSNTSRGGLGDPASQHGSLFFLTGSSTFMTRAAGFTTGFSFFYSDVNFTGGSFTVYSGIDGTGSVLASLVLPLTPSGPCRGYSAGFCPYVPIGLAFSGTAESVVFGGIANQIVFDDVTFGSVTPGGGGSVVPEPGTMSLLAMGLVGIGGMTRRRRRKA